MLWSLGNFSMGQPLIQSDNRRKAVFFLSLGERLVFLWKDGDCIQWCWRFSSSNVTAQQWVYSSQSDFNVRSRSCDSWLHHWHQRHCCLGHSRSAGQTFVAPWCCQAVQLFWNLAGRCVGIPAPPSCSQQDAARTDGWIHGNPTKGAQIYFRRLDSWKRYRSLLFKQEGPRALHFKLSAWAMISFVMSSMGKSQIIRVLLWSCCESVRAHSWGREPVVLRCSMYGGVEGDTGHAACWLSTWVYCPF